MGSTVLDTSTFLFSVYVDVDIYLYSHKCYIGSSLLAPYAELMWSGSVFVFVYTDI